LLRLRALLLVSTTVTIQASAINYSLVVALGPKDRFNRASCRSASWLAVGPKDRYIGHLVAPHRGLRLVSTTATVHASSINYSLVVAVGPKDRFNRASCLAPPRQ
jgi:hypothetical protein